MKGQYNVESVNTPCLRETIEAYESKCGKFSDYGLQFAKNFTEACETYKSAEIVREIAC